MKLTADQYSLYYLRASNVQSLSYSSVVVSFRDFQLITQNSSGNIASRQSRCIYVNGIDSESVISLLWNDVEKRCVLN